jgi:hypothetical protein
MRKCSVEGCGKKCLAKGLCQYHYNRDLKAKTALIKHCLVEGCDREYLANGYCTRHYHQLRDYGEILERTQHDPNEFIIDGDICWIVLYDIKYNEIAKSKIDTKYYQQIKDSKLKWHLKDGYVEAYWYDQNGNRQHILLHQAIIQLTNQEIPDGYEIDHKDRDPLNNLEENLRVCTRSQNAQNKGKQSNNLSGQKGVSWNVRENKWEAFISGIYLGRFILLEDAARAYNAAAIKLHGEFAVLNEIPEKLEKEIENA